MESNILTKNVALKLAKTEKLALVSGSFDILHPGHLYLFNKTKELAPDAKLLVLIMDDANIKRRKGPDRPINRLDERIDKLLEIPKIDFILPWTEEWENIAKFVVELKPAYFTAVIGDPGFENKRKIIQSIKGKFLEIEKLHGYSTSEIIAKSKLFLPR